MSYNFDERLAYVQKGDEVVFETRNGSYDVTVEEVEYFLNGKGDVESVTITPQELMDKGQYFTYRRSSKNPYKTDSFQPDKVIDYKLKDSWNNKLGTEKSLSAVGNLLGWEKEKPFEAPRVVED